MGISVQGLMLTFSCLSCERTDRRRLSDPSSSHLPSPSCCGECGPLGAALHPHSRSPRPFAKFSHLLNLLRRPPEVGRPSSTSAAPPPPLILKAALWSLASLLSLNLRSGRERCVKNWALFPHEWRGRKGELERNAILSRYPPRHVCLREGGRPCSAAVYASSFIIASMLHHHRIFEALGSQPLAASEEKRARTAGRRRNGGRGSVGWKKVPAS